MTPARLLIVLCILPAMLLSSCSTQPKREVLQRQLDDLRQQINKLAIDAKAADDAALEAQAPVAQAAAAASAAQSLAKVALEVAQSNSTAIDGNNEHIDRMFKKSASKDGGGGNTSAASDNTTKKYTTLRVFYASDRTFGPSDSKQYEYLGDRAKSVTYGVCDVSIPNIHELGVIESPKWWHFELHEDPSNHFVVQRITQETHDQFLTDVRRRTSLAARPSAFVFVHGYNTSFDDAAKRTAQIAYDLKFDGAPVFFSWPSVAALRGYPDDESNVEWATHDLEAFLIDFLQHTSSDNVYLIAHSMGSRALTNAFKGIAESHPELRKKVKEIILAAPDIDSGVFVRDIAPAIVGSGGVHTPITLYASARDKALTLSKTFHGYPRAGDSTGGALNVSGVDTIDATAVDTDMIGHAYFGTSRSVLEDIFALLSSGQRACHRFGMSSEKAGDGSSVCVLLP